MSIKLSPRLNQILDLAAQGLTDKQVASHLGLSVTTVHSHWRKLREHFDSSSRTEIVARVRASSLENDLLGRVAEETAMLLFQLGERDRLMAQLEEANARLLEESRMRSMLLQQGLAEYARKMSKALQRLEYLERLNELTHQLKVVPHEGEYGSSWRKHYIAESVSILNGTAETWVSGEFTFFDACDPECLAEALLDFEPFGRAQERIVCSWIGLRSDGERRQMLDLLSAEPPDESGVGRYRSVCLDITDWVDLLREKIDQGWPARMQPRQTDPSAASTPQSDRTES